MDSYSFEKKDLLDSTEHLGKPSHSSRRHSHSHSFLFAVGGALKSLFGLVLFVLVLCWFFLVSRSSSSPSSSSESINNNNEFTLVPQRAALAHAKQVTNCDQEKIVTKTVTVTQTIVSPSPVPVPMNTIQQQQQELPRPPRYVFVDLGANNGDTCWSFLQDPRANDKVTFPKPPGKNYTDAEIYLFEANPNFSAELVAVKQELVNKGIKVEIFPGTPVWVEKTTLPFHVQTDGGHHAAGSSLDPHHPDISESRGGKTVNLTTISIAHWLLSNFLPQDFVVVKMDIELAEYTIFPHLVDMQAYSVIDYMFIEWHFWLINQTDPRIARVKEAEKIMRAKGVQLPNYATAA